MEESKLLKVAVVCSLLGVSILFMLSSVIKIPEPELKDISVEDLGKVVKVQGLVTSIRSTEKVTMLEIAQHNKMPVIIFDNNITLSEGDEIQIYGKVEEYNGKAELIADMIELV